MPFVVFLMPVRVNLHYEGIAYHLSYVLFL